MASHIKVHQGLCQGRGPAPAIAEDSCTVRTREKLPSSAHRTPSPLAVSCQTLRRKQALPHLGPYLPSILHVLSPAPLVIKATA